MSTQNAVTIEADVATRLQNHLNKLVELAVSIHEMATEGADGAEWRLVAIEQLAQICARKADIVATAIGGLRAGNFEQEFEELATGKILVSRP